MSYFFTYGVGVRADRLVAIVLLFQLRGRLTAAELARQLETSERTIRRDLDSLCMAGVPLYSQRGRGGGWSLIGGHRIDLTGLTADEARALFLAIGPGSTSALGPGVGQGLGAARRKVLAALPPPLRQQVEVAANALLIDHSPWGGAPPAHPGSPGDPHDDPHLVRLQAAVLAGVQVVVEYEPPGRPTEERRLHPQGLVCKRGVWYLVAVAPAGLRTYRLSRVRSVTLTEDPVERPEGFDLAEAWAGVQRWISDRLAGVVAVRVAVAPDALDRLRAVVGSWWPVAEIGATDDARALVEIHFPKTAVAVAELAGLVDLVEVLTPPEVRTGMAEMGRRLVDRYGSPA